VDEESAGFTVEGDPNEKGDLVVAAAGAVVAGEPNEKLAAGFEPETLGIPNENPAPIAGSIVIPWFLGFGSGSLRQKGLILVSLSFLLIHLLVNS